MAVPDERLVLEASVVDNFSSTLEDLADNLRAVDRLASQTIENLTADVDATEAKAELTELGAVKKAVSDDIEIGTDVDIDTDLGDEIDGIEDVFDNDGNLQIPSTPDIEASGGGGATADGGGGDTSLLTKDEIERAQEEFGEAFDASALFGDDPARRVAELTQDDLREYIDEDAARQAIADGEIELDLFEQFGEFDSDEAFDALEKMREAGITNLPTSLTDRFRNLELKMGDFFRIFAALIPLLAVFVGAIPAAISGIVALGGAALAAAGALAGVGGLALLSGVLTADGEVDTSQLTERIENLFDEAAAEMGPVVQQFAPLLDESFQTIEDTIAGIADRADVFRRVVGDAEGALQFLEETVPSAMADIVRFGDAAMPIIAGVIREAGNMDILAAFADLIIRLAPLLSLLTKFLLGALPALIQVSQGFLMVATALSGVIFVIGRLIDVVPYAGQVIGLLAGVLLALVSASALVVLTTGSGVIPAILGMSGSMLTSIPIVGTLATKLHVAALRAYEFVGGLLASAKALLVQYTPNVIRGIAATLGLSTSFVTAAISAGLLLGILTLGLGPALGFLSTQFNDLSSDIDKATSSLESFASASDSLDGTQVGVNGGMNPTGAGGASGGYQDASQITVVAGDKESGNAIANGLAFTSIGGQLSESSVNNRRHDGGT